MLTRGRSLQLVATLMILLGLGTPVMAAEPVAKISILSSGKVLLDGKPTTMAALDSALSALAVSKGVVWYYRETAEAAEPPAAATQVIELVIKHRLPISMSTKRDFSDVVGADGRPRPRKP